MSTANLARHQPIICSEQTNFAHTSMISCMPVCVMHASPPYKFPLHWSTLCEILQAADDLPARQANLRRDLKKKAKQASRSIHAYMSA